tara:strand:+ start:98 stop:496 length:399 start_codon:yes stop_codon:yes gene_type:complete
MKENLKEKYDRTKMWYDSATKLLVNRTIERVWWQEWDEEYPGEGTGLVFETDKGDAFFIGMDDEGNGPGALHVGMSDERREEFKKAKLCASCLPVGVESSKSYKEMWLAINGLNNMNWNEAGHTELEEVKDD